MNIDLLGGIGGALFGIAAFPSVWKAITTGSATEVPAKTIWLFFFACLTYFSWLFIKFGIQWPFFFGAMETCSWSVIGFFHYFPRKGKGRDVSVVEMMAKAAWDDHGPCAPQCNAECDGACAEVYRTGKVL